MGNSGYWNKMIIDLPQIEENKELFASHIDLEEEEKKLKEENEKLRKKDSKK